MFDPELMPGCGSASAKNAASSALFVRFLADIASRVADAGETPRWNPGDFFGETFGRPPAQR